MTIFLQLLLNNYRPRWTVWWKLLVTIFLAIFFVNCWWSTFSAVFQQPLLVELWQSSPINFRRTFLWKLFLLVATVFNNCRWSTFKNRFSIATNKNSCHKNNAKNWWPQWVFGFLNLLKESNNYHYSLRYCDYK